MVPSFSTSSVRNCSVLVNSSTWKKKPFEQTTHQHLATFSKRILLNFWSIEVNKKITNIKICLKDCWLILVYKVYVT